MRWMGWMQGARWKALAIAALLCCWMAAGQAAPVLKGEYERTTGLNWYIPGYKATYEVSDPKVAEVLTNKGRTYVHFLAPGDVYVYVTFYAVTGEPAETEAYLFHIAGNPMDDNSFQWGMFAMDVLRLTNAEREKAGIPPLKPAFDLSDAALIRVEEATRSFSHTRPDGTPYYTVFEKGSYRSAGENLQAGAATPEAVVEAWMNSPGHRANILNDDFTELGVGYRYDADSPYHHYWVQLFRRS